MPGPCGCCSRCLPPDDRQAKKELNAPGVNMRHGPTRSQRNSVPQASRSSPAIGLASGIVGTGRVRVCRWFARVLLVSLERTAFQTDIVSSVAASQVVQADTNQHRSSGQVAIISSSDQDAGGREACEFAKQERKSVRDRLGMNITYEGIQQLDEMVHHACK